MSDALRDQVRAFILENYLFTSDTKALGVDDSLLGRGIVDSTGMLEIIFKDDALYAIVPGQPQYKLENVGGRRYRLANAPAGFFVTFRPAKDAPNAVELYLEQPHGNHTFVREPSPDGAAAQLAGYSGPHKDLLGTYSRTNF